MQNHKFDSQCHDHVAHAGRDIIINQARMSGFWVIGLNIAVRSMISKSVRYKHITGRFQQQIVVDLPRDRLRNGPKNKAV